MSHDILPDPAVGPSSPASPAPEATDATTDATTPSRHASAPAGSRLALGATAALALVVPLLTLTDLPVPVVRPLLVVAFVLLVPGVPVVSLLGMRDAWARVVTVGLVSAGSQVVLATALVTAGVLDALAVTAVIGLVGMLLTILAWQGTRPGDGAAATLAAARERVSLAAQGAGPMLLALGAVLAVWAVGVARAGTDEFDDLGLVASLGPAVWVAVAALGLLCALELRRSHPRGLVAGALVLAVVLVLQGTPVIVEGVGGVPVGWLHLSFADHMAETGGILTGKDARFSWPGFFALLGVVVPAAGLGDGADLLRWAPLLNGLLVLPPLVLLARSVSRSARVVVLAPLVYAGFNWYQQDYLAPQAMALLLMLGVVAVLLHVGRGGVGEPTVDRRVLLGLMLLPLAAIAVSHQLTPPVTVGMLLVLAIAKRTALPKLWLVMLAFTVLWTVFGASDFWMGHLDQIFGTVGQVDGNVTAGVADRVVGTDGHVRMLALRMVLSALVLLLGGLGFLRLVRDPAQRRTGWMLAALAMGPFGLILLQSYGGEVVMRCFVFALPALAVLAATGIEGVLGIRGDAAATPTGARAMVLPVVGGVLLALVLATQVAARGANAPFEETSATQLEATRLLVEQRGDDEVVLSFGWQNPLGLLPAAQPRNQEASEETCGSLGFGLECVEHWDAEWIYASATDDAYWALTTGEPGQGMAIAEELLAQGGWVEVYRADDVLLLAAADRG
ncbi:hypothetical protein [Nocardioides bruguierae]|uniref:hypothetical protein n=1 Tax=Nocardioides bruguierae TaxID=2945102 RepID=UPI0020211291|nr:hypothetical protein [Nocardioides bruguierae]MCL8026150.1 hypothetical protein [Nocardioides bruguierae]